VTRYLVTGHTGFIGGEVACQLQAAGHEVRGLSRSDGGDIRDARSVSAAAAGCDAIVHAAYAPVRAPSREIMDVAVSGTLSVLRACEDHGIRGLVLVSSPLASEVTGGYPSEEAAYGTGKLAAEAMAAAWARAGVPPRLVISRPFNVYGPGGGYDHVIPQFITRIARLDREQPRGVILFPVRGSPDTVRSFCYITDCGSQLAELAWGVTAGPPRAVLCDTGVNDGRTIASVAYEIARCFGRQIEIRAVPGTALPGRRVPARNIPPSVVFAAGLARTVAWYRKHEEAADAAGKA
jgi:nucleoside-diphosphate-sugar epimerase